MPHGLTGWATGRPQLTSLSVQVQIFAKYKRAEARVEGGWGRVESMKQVQGASVIANSPALTLASLNVALGGSGAIIELSATPIAQQLISANSLHVLPARCSRRPVQVAPINLHIHLCSFSLLGECNYRASITSTPLRHSGSAI